MKKYLDPKADLTFKKVFGEHKDLVISFLNAMLPFGSEEEKIVSVEYLNPELVPVNPLRKDSIVDVRCKDVRGRQFIVEMQMMWTPEYKQRVLFNSSKAYVSQLGKSQHYELLQPVYSLNLLNDTFSDSEEYYHDYQIVEMEETNEVIEGLRFIFIELPKFKPKSYGDKKMQVLWLRYLTEIDEDTREVSKELLDNPEISKAVEELEKSAFTEEELLVYDRFWDMIGASRLLIIGAIRRGHEQGHKQGHEEGYLEGRQEGRQEGRREGRREGRQEGITQGHQEERVKNARAMKSKGFQPDIISEITGLPISEIAGL